MLQAHVHAIRAQACLLPREDEVLGTFQNVFGVDVVPGNTSRLGPRGLGFVGLGSGGVSARENS